MIPVNLQLLRAHEFLSGPGLVLCEFHANLSVGFCTADDCFLCEMCVFDHMEHECWALDSDQADAYTLHQKQKFNRQLEFIRFQTTIWQAHSCNIEALWGNLAITPVAMKLNSGETREYPCEYDESNLLIAFKELAKLMSACHQLSQTLKLQSEEFEKRLQTFHKIPITEKVRVKQRTLTALPDTQELLTSFTLLLNRLDFSESYSILHPSGL